VCAGSAHGVRVRAILVRGRHGTTRVGRRVQRDSVDVLLVRRVHRRVPAPRRGVRAVRELGQLHVSRGTVNGGHFGDGQTGVERDFSVAAPRDSVARSVRVRVHSRRGARGQVRSRLRCRRDHMFGKLRFMFGKLQFLFGLLGFELGFAG